MSFGFDPSIILSGKQYTGPDANETMRTLADLAMRRVQTQQAQASLADMAQQRAQQQSLADIYRQNAGAPEGLSSALMRGGFGREALEVGGVQAAQQKSLAELQERGMAILRNRAAAVKTPEQYAQFISVLPADARAKFGLPDQYDPAAVDSFVAAGIPAEKRPQIEHDRASLEETKRHNGEMEKRPAAGGIPIVITGEGGAQYFVNPRNPTQPAAPVMGPDGKQIAKPTASEDKLAERNVGGFTFDRKNPPSPEGAKKMANAVVARDKAQAALDRLEKLFDDNGTELFGEVASQMESEWKQATDQVRIIGEMGVPNGSDYVMLEKQIPNPVGMSGAKQSNSSIKAKFAVLKKQLADTVGATAKAYKYTPEGSESAGAVRIASDADYEKLASGTEFIDPDGKRRRKP